ncbi:TetR/AcrR family transcriptional regulator [Nocardiopsis algeriensis]|uniref:AcrR family transcriptional regulator n=1 Tax=Nocardiopsis algeriensis TaxID=1478215 RepID=A0A841IR12_9ACTN|nr:TetR/AcrR family transcriptional regulator [Nocardiopsis algeriensis]MBB6121127.1 AcrR family transcriptional regulator [Nocardiopsis algeriensis]
MQPVDKADEGGDREEETFVEAARREQIVSAAVEAIAEEGYAKASFVRIAKRAGISPGLITYHFRTKENLIRRVLADIDARLDRSMEGGPEPLEGFEDALRRIVTGHVSHCARNPREMTARREIQSAATLSAGLRTEIAEGDRAGRAELVAFLADGQRHGEFREFDPEVFADSLLTVLVSVSRALDARPADAHAAYGRELADLFCAAATGRSPDR